MGATNIPALGEVFKIVHKSTGKYLVPKQIQNTYKSLLILSDQCEDNENQLWQIEQLISGNCEIIHAKSCLILDQKDKSPYLNWKKKGKQSQQWYIQRASEESNSLIIRRNKLSSQSILYYEQVFMGPLDKNNQVFHFQFKLAKHSSFNNTCIITSAHSGKSMDIQWACLKKGTKIIQWPKHKRLNQRWILIRIGNVFAIKSAFSELFLDIKGQNSSEGGKIIQWTNNHKSNQLWRLEQQDDNSFIISSVLNPILILAVKNRSLSDQANIVTATRDQPYYWQIDGHIPQLFSE